MSIRGKVLGGPSLLSRRGILFAFFASVFFAGTAALTARVAEMAGRTASPPAARLQRPAEANNYLCGLDEKLPLFFELRGQLRLVVIGDCRANYAIDPRLFFGSANWTHPMALNLAVDSIGFEVEETLLTEYVPHAPNLEWIVYQISPRLFNTYYQDGSIDKLKSSPGYKYDTAHRDEIWSELPPDALEAWDVKADAALLKWGDFSELQGFCSILSDRGNKATPSPQKRVWQLLTPHLRSAVQQMAQGDPLSQEDQQLLLSALNAMIDNPDFYRREDFKEMPVTPRIKNLLDLRDEGIPAGGRQMLNRTLLEAAFPDSLRESVQETYPWGWHENLKGSGTSPNAQDFIKRAQNGRYEFDAHRWERFVRIIDFYGRRHVRILAVVTPMHYSLAAAPDADNDGTPDAAYRALMTRLKELELTHPNFFFRDMHRDGRNGFTDAEYYDWDHLNANGGRRLTAQLEEIRKAVDARPKLDVMRPAVAGITAVGDPGRVDVAFTKPVSAADAADADSYSIDHRVTVKAARLSPDMQTVTLKTSPLAENVTYSLTVRNVKDRSDNIVVPGAMRFTFAKSLDLRDTSRANYTWDKLKLGAPVTIDQPLAFTSVPDQYAGLDALKTAEADKAATGDAFLSFNVNYPVRVYVAHDESVLTLPSWMDSFTWTWDFLKAGKSEYRLAWKDFPAGRVTLGGNAADSGHMYAVVVRPLGEVGIARGNAVSGVATTRASPVEKERMP